jgi:hypothetical protein
MATVGAISVHCIAGLLVSIHGIDALHALPVVPSRVGLHAVSVPHPWGWSSANRTAVAMAISIAVADRLSLGKVASGGIAILVIVAAAIVATPSASVGAHGICVVDAHRLRPTPVLDINGSLERADRVEWALPSGTSGVGKIGVDCAMVRG